MSHANLTQWHKVATAQIGGLQMSHYVVHRDGLVLSFEAGEVKAQRRAEFFGAEYELAEGPMPADTTEASRAFSDAYTVRMLSQSPFERAMAQSVTDPDLLADAMLAAGVFDDLVDAGVFDDLLFGDEEPVTTVERHKSSCTQLKPVAL